MDLWGSRRRSWEHTRVCTGGFCTSCSYPSIVPGFPPESSEKFPRKRSWSRCFSVSEKQPPALLARKAHLTRALPQLPLNWCLQAQPRRGGGSPADSGGALGRASQDHSQAAPSVGRSRGAPRTHLVRLPKASSRESAGGSYVPTVGQGRGDGAGRAHKSGAGASQRFTN